MRISKLTIRGFRGVKHADINFPQHSVLVGPNNCGKTTIIEALALLFGRDRLVPRLTEHDFFGSDPVLLQDACTQRRRNRPYSSRFRSAVRPDSISKICKRKSFGFSLMMTILATPSLMMPISIPYADAYCKNLAFSSPPQPGPGIGGLVSLLNSFVACSVLWVEYPRTQYGQRENACGCQPRRTRSKLRRD
jgi:hypothetical protein